MSRGDLKEGEDPDAQPAPRGDSDPAFQDQEKKSMDRDGQEEGEDPDAFYNRDPAKSFDKIARDPKQLAQFDDEILNEFIFFTEGETQQLLKDEIDRRAAQ